MFQVCVGTDTYNVSILCIDRQTDRYLQCFKFVYRQTDGQLLAMFQVCVGTDTYNVSSL